MQISAGDFKNALKSEENFCSRSQVKTRILHEWMSLTLWWPSVLLSQNRSSLQVVVQIVCCNTRLQQVRCSGRCSRRTLLPFCSSQHAAMSVLHPLKLEASRARYGAEGLSGTDSYPRTWHMQTQIGTWVCERVRKICFYE